MQEKIIDLETKFSFQEDLLEELNKEMALQQRKIESMSAQLNSLTDQLAELMVRGAGEQGAAPLDEKPPHY